ncbi:hypothetical protein Dda_2703 [Drechslerella dactyloides]|uniref:Uncharacterized protein n=1 Tax=Drechslerella dactyloides TaxID=74499 RepID=A0AAD6J1I3_DREDA|nr:hypothetical protein Dda_2703 [Drechslerella dactyloides]
MPAISKWRRCVVFCQRQRNTLSDRSRHFGTSVVNTIAIINAASMTPHLATMQPSTEKAMDTTTPATSTLTLAFASFILLNKPPELSATEFIYYLRGCVQKDPASRTSHLHHLSNDAYWRNIVEDKDLKILELDQKLVDATIENRRLTEQLKRKRDDDDNDNIGGPKPKKAKPQPAAEETTIDHDALIKWQPVQKIYASISSGGNLFTALRSLHHAADAQTIALRTTTLCKALSSKIDTLTRQPNDDTPPPQPPQDARRTRLSDAKRRSLDAAWVTDVTTALDDAFRRLFMAITRLQDITQSDPSSADTCTSVACAVTELVCSILDSIHAASQEHARTPHTCTRDIRSGVTNILQSFLATLAAASTNNNPQSDITENILYTIVEAAGKCLCLPSTSPAAEKAARKETAAYILELLKVAVPLYRSQLANHAVDSTDANVTATASPVLELAKRRFHDAVMKGLFGERKTPSWDDLAIGAKDATADSGRKWGGVDMQEEFVFVDEEGFAEGVWKILDLEDFALVW